MHTACKKLEWWDAGAVMCLGQGVDLHMAQLVPLPLTVSFSSKSRLVLPSWFYLPGAGSPMQSWTKSKGRCVTQKSLLEHHSKVTDVTEMRCLKTITKMSITAVCKMVASIV